MGSNLPIPILSIDAVAEHMGVHRKTVERWIHRGEMGHVPAGRRRLVRADQLQAFIDAHTINPDDD